MARGTARWKRPASAIASKTARGSSRSRSISSALARICGASLRAASSGDGVVELFTVGRSRLVDPQRRTPRGPPGSEASRATRLRKGNIVGYTFFAIDTPVVDYKALVRE